MSTPLIIQRITELEPSAHQKLKTFCVSWRNAAKLVLQVVRFTEQPKEMRGPLEAAMTQYMEGRVKGLSDIERLTLVLREVLTAASKLTPDMTVELFADWCVKHNIPEAAYIREVRSGRHD
ncbi:MAG: hypothetical protein KAI85_02595 [Halopseudomonas aestusnigri]|nr:hypothetical protein [Halopseudomonas aestusnigri]